MVPELHTSVCPRTGVNWTAEALRDIVSLFDDPRRPAVENLESFSSYCRESCLMRSLLALPGCGHLWKDGWPPENGMPGFTGRASSICTAWQEASWTL